MGSIASDSYNQNIQGVAAKMIHPAKNLRQAVCKHFPKLHQSFHSDRDFNLFLAVGFFSGISSGITTSCFNNYLNDVYHLSEAARGIVEFPRELPGALLIFIFAVLNFVSDIKLAAISMILASLGMLGLGVLSPGFAFMLIWMVVLNLGTHLFMPLAPGIGMNLSKQEQYGVRLGRYNAYNLTAAIIGYLIVWLGFQYFHISYTFTFAVASVCYLIAGGILLLMKPQKTRRPKTRFVIKKKFTLYYLLSIVNGARKQIFLTFAPWVLIKVYHLGTPSFALLGFVIAFVSITTRTIVGKAIDKLGERIILSAEAIVLILLCMGYAFSADLFPVSVAVIITAACYVLDNSLSAVEMARSTYVRKISEDPSEVIPTLSTGTSFDHVVAMTIPFFGGLIWTAFSYKFVFILAALIALSNLFLSMRIKTPPARPIQE
ncbi:MAG TPA: MFS transporter [Clostridia bacterium]|nr:MFS transporter [Clostridia bacterium]